MRPRPDDDNYFTECDRCHAPRQLVMMMYGERLLIHPLPEGASNKSNSHDEEVLVLCGYCSDMKTKGKSGKRPIQPFTVCEFCKQPVWDYSDFRGHISLCQRCAFRCDGVSDEELTQKNLFIRDEGAIAGIDMWKYILTQIVRNVDKNVVYQALGLITSFYEDRGITTEELETQLNELPFAEGYHKRLRGDPNEQLLKEFKPIMRPN